MNIYRIKGTYTATGLWPDLAGFDRLVVAESLEQGCAICAANYKDAQITYANLRDVDILTAETAAAAKEAKEAKEGEA